MLWRKREPEKLPAVIEAEPQIMGKPAQRNKQENIKASGDCKAAFAAIAKAVSMTKAELFEDMVAERLEGLKRQGVRVEIA